MPGSSTAASGVLPPALAAHLLGSKPPSFTAKESTSLDKEIETLRALQLGGGQGSLPTPSSPSAKDDKIAATVTATARTDTDDHLREHVLRATDRAARSCLPAGFPPALAARIVGLNGFDQSASPGSSSSSSLARQIEALKALQQPDESVALHRAPMLPQPPTLPPPSALGAAAAAAMAAANAPRGAASGRAEGGTSGGPGSGSIMAAQARALEAELARVDAQRAAEQAAMRERRRVLAALATAAKREAEEEALAAVAVKGGAKRGMRRNGASSSSSSSSSNGALPTPPSVSSRSAGARRSSLEDAVMDQFLRQAAGVDQESLRRLLGIERGGDSEKAQPSASVSLAALVGNCKTTEEGAVAVAAAKGARTEAIVAKKKSCRSGKKGKTRQRKPGRCSGDMGQNSPSSDAPSPPAPPSPAPASCEVEDAEQRGSGGSGGSGGEGAAAAASFTRDLDKAAISADAASSATDAPALAVPEFHQTITAATTTTTKKSSTGSTTDAVLVVVITLPLCASASDVCLDVTPARLALVSAPFAAAAAASEGAVPCGGGGGRDRGGGGGCGYQLDAALLAEVDPDRAAAKWSKQKRTLTVTLPVVRLK